MIKKFLNKLKFVFYSILVLYIAAVSISIVIRLATHSVDYIEKLLFY